LSFSFYNIEWKIIDFFVNLKIKLFRYALLSSVNWSIRVQALFKQMFDFLLIRIFTRKKLDSGFQLTKFFR